MAHKKGKEVQEMVEIQMQNILVLKLGMDSLFSQVRSFLNKEEQRYILAAM